MLTDKAKGHCIYVPSFLGGGGGGGGQFRINVLCSQQHMKELKKREKMSVKYSSDE